MKKFLVFTLAALTASASAAYAGCYSENRQIPR